MIKAVLIYFRVAMNRFRADLKSLKRGRTNMIGKINKEKYFGATNDRWHWAILNSIKREDLGYEIACYLI